MVQGSGSQVEGLGMWGVYSGESGHSFWPPAPHSQSTSLSKGALQVSTEEIFNFLLYCTSKLMRESMALEEAWLSALFISCLILVLHCRMTEIGGK